MLAWIVAFVNLRVNPPLNIRFSLAAVKSFASSSTLILEDNFLIFEFAIFITVFSEEISPVKESLIGEYLSSLATNSSFFFLSLDDFSDISPYLFISSVTGKNIQQLKDLIWKEINQ
jgi:hypothetical protein